MTEKKEIMGKEEFVAKIEAMGFSKQEPLIACDDIYIKQIGNYQIKIDFWTDSIKCWLLFDTTIIATFERLLFNDKTISILKNLLKGFSDKDNNDNTYNITFDVEGIIEEARFCGYKINEEQAKELIDYLDRKADGVYETIQQYITGYCQNNKFEELKEDEE